MGIAKKGESFEYDEFCKKFKGLIKVGDTLKKEMEKALDKKRKRCNKPNKMPTVKEEESGVAWTKKSNSEMDRSGLDDTEEDDAMSCIYTHDDNEELEQKRINDLSLFSAIQNYRLHRDPFPAEE